MRICPDNCNEPMVIMLKKSGRNRHYTKLPNIDLKELDKFKEQNFKERLEFQDKYIEWMKKTGNIK
jgi:hypothetical protein